jgi:hypothetical protein
VGVISKMTSFADLVKNGVLMIIPIYNVHHSYKIKNLGKILRIMQT